MSLYSSVRAVASYLPNKILTNTDLAKNVNTNHEWIFSRTGIKQRHIAEENETVSFMATKVAHKLININNLDLDEIGIIIVATSTSSLLLPSCASFVQESIKADKAIAFDVNSACSGFVYALHVAELMMSKTQGKYALVIGSEVMSSIVDWTDRSTSILFGDGAGGFLLQKQKNPGILCSHLSSSGNTSLLRTHGTVNSSPFYIKMNGREVFKHAVSAFKCVIDALLDKSSLKMKDVTWLLPHQANIRIINALEKYYQVGYERWIATIDVHGNTSSASIPLALCSHIKNTGQIAHGDVIMMVAFGAGFTSGGCLVRCDQKLELIE